MFQIKSQSNFTKIFAVLLLVLFVAGGSFSALHVFSHHNSVNVDVSSHEKNQDKKSAHCLFCFFSNSQNHFDLTPQIFYAVAAFYLGFLARKFDRAKLSYLLSSQAPRAPPVIF